MNRAVPSIIVDADWIWCPGSYKNLSVLSMGNINVRTGHTEIQVLSTLGSTEKKDRILQIANRERYLDGCNNFRCLSGKWLIFRDATEVDALWSKIAIVTMNKLLGMGAKVSTTKGALDHNGQYVICVYTANCTDKQRFTAAKVYHNEALYEE